MQANALFAQENNADLPPIEDIPILWHRPRQRRTRRTGLTPDD